MIEALPLIVLSFAAYRITRFIVFDSLIDGLRHKFYNRLLQGTRAPRIRNKILDLTSCTWCLGFWISLSLLSLYLGAWPWQLTLNNWLVAFAVAGAQGMLHALEPGDE